MKKLIYVLVAPAVLFWAVGCKTATGVPDGKTDGRLIELADPTIFYHQGTYYLYGTGSPQGFRVYTSRDLKTWEMSTVNSGFALRKGDSFGDRGFWAPQVFEFGGEFYMAYTANENIAIAKSGSPLGPFKQETIKKLEAPVRQIDPFIFIDDDGKKYMYHVRVADGGNRIFVAEMEGDFSAIKPETLRLCIEAGEPWENIENAKWSVTEGPTLVKRDGLYYLIYSCNDFRSKDYAVGYATSESPLGPWKKFEKNPVIRRDILGYPGTGHGDLLNGKNGLYYVFHTHASDTAVAPRKTAIVKARFAKDGSNPQQWQIDKKSFRYLTVRE